MILPSQTVGTGFQDCCNNLSGLFTSLKGQPIEFELKFLYRPEYQETSFSDLIRKFFNADYIRICNISRDHIETHQFETPNRDLWKTYGASLRTRASKKNGVPVSADVCLKVEKEGSLIRCEYETPIDPSEHKIVKPQLLKKVFPSTDDYPLCHEILSFCEHSYLTDCFLIDARRIRSVIEIDNKVLDLKPEQKCYGELIFDTVSFYYNNQELTFIAQDKEVELELIKKPCRYNKYPQASSHICQNLSYSDEIKAMTYMHDTLLDFSHNKLIYNKLSKANRAFAYLEEHEKKHTAHTFQSVLYSSPENLM